MLLTTALLLFGAALLILVLADSAVQRLPLTPALVFLAVGWLAGAVLGAPSTETLESFASTGGQVAETALLLALFAVGLRLRLVPTWHAWRVALLMAGPGMVLTVAAGGLAAAVLLDLPWAAALLLGAVMAPTDPVLASEVQIRHDKDRDAVRLSLTAEGALNDCTAQPAVTLALGLLGLHSMGPFGLSWLGLDLLWPIGGAIAIGVLLGRGVGQGIRMRIEKGDRLARDELLYVSAVALAYGISRLTHTSTFIMVFAVGTTLLWPLHDAALAHRGHDLAKRMQDFGGRVERLIEGASMLMMGVALHSVQPRWQNLAFGLVLALVVRPLAVLALVRRSDMNAPPRRLVAWFGIRGIGSLYYLAFVMQSGVTGGVAADFIAATLYAVALSIVLHGISATPLMARYQRRRERTPRP